MFSSEFGVQFDLDQTRNWLRSLSKIESETTLILAIDIGDTSVIDAELDELVSGTFGENLRIVVAVDDASVKKLTLNSSQRQSTRFGGLAETIETGALDDDEFGATLEVLLERHNIGLYNGAQRASEYRVPWLLRSIVAEVAQDPNFNTAVSYTHLTLPTILLV